MNISWSLLTVIFASILTTTGCGEGSSKAATSASTAGSAKTSETSPTTIYKVTKERVNEGGCEADKATPAAELLTPYVVVAALGGTMGQSQITGCSDPKACAQIGKQIAAGDSLSAAYMMPLDKRGKESSTGAILYGGKQEGGKCTGVHEERVTLTESGATGRIETTEVFYEDYAGEASDCSAGTARKKKVAETCKSLRVMELERAAAP